MPRTCIEVNIRCFIRVSVCRAVGRIDYLSSCFFLLAIVLMCVVCRLMGASAMSCGGSNTAEIIKIQRTAAKCFIARTELSWKLKQGEQAGPQERIACVFLMYSVISML